MSSFIHKEDLEMWMWMACIYIPCGLSAPALQSEQASALLCRGCLTEKEL